MNEKSSKTLMGCLCIELTRRCNLNCVFCSKGKSQNIDISKETIDKIIDEMKEIYIYQLRLLGGEPFLVPEMITYLVDKIINEKIKISNVLIFTNGTIRNPQIKADLNKLANYLCKNHDNDKIFTSFADKYFSIPYKKADKKINIIISTEFHANEKEINKTIDFYLSPNNSNIAVLNQKESFKGSTSDIVIEGEAEKNHTKILTNPIDFNVVRTINNLYNYFHRFEVTSDEVFNDFSELILITKTISISSNGNVFGGSSSSYQTIDKNPLFNINCCKSNFCNKLLHACLAHPISEKSAQIKERYKTYSWLKENNYKIITPGLSEYDEDEEKKLGLNLEILVSIVDTHEKTILKILSQYPYLSITEAETMAIAEMYIKIVSIAFIPKVKVIFEYFVFYLNYIELPLDLISNFTVDGMLRVIENLKKENNLRKSNNGAFLDMNF